jgi:hypothetical protein
MSAWHFPSFPMPAEGETVFSLFTRCKATTGFLDEVILQELTGQRLTSRLRSQLPAYLPTMAGKLHKNHPCSDPLFVVRNYSIFPYLSYFMPDSIRTNFEVKVASVDWTQPIALSMGLAKYPVSIMTPHRYCPTCVEEGIKEYGFPYFRREHQLPGVYFCWKHAEVLCHGCKRCGEYPLRGASLALAGECKCDSGIEPLQATSIKDSQAQPLLWLAEQSARLLTFSGTRVSDPTASLRQKAIAEGGVRTGIIDYRRIAQKMADFWGEEILRLLNINMYSGKEPAPWIRRFFYGDRGNRPTILYLLLVGAYFGSVSEFELDSSSKNDWKNTPSRKVVDMHGLLQKHRGILLKLVEENSDLSRGDFQKMAPGSYDFLIRHDKEFFQLKIQRAKASCAPRRERADWTALDMIKASELRVYFKNEFNKNEKPVFITTTSALRFCKIFAKYRVDSSHFPQVSEILSTNLEDRDSFHKRRLCWAISEMKRTRVPISANRLRRVAVLELKVLHDNRDFILSTVQEVGGEVDDRSFLA